MCNFLPSSKRQHNQSIDIQLNLFIICHDFTHPSYMQQCVKLPRTNEQTVLRDSREPISCKLVRFLPHYRLCNFFSFFYARILHETSWPSHTFTLPNEMVRGNHNATTDKKNPIELMLDGSEKKISAKPSIHCKCLYVMC